MSPEIEDASASEGQFRNGGKEREEWAGADLNKIKERKGNFPKLQND